LSFLPTDKAGRELRQNYYGIYPKVTLPTSKGSRTKRKKSNGRIFLTHINYLDSFLVNPTQMTIKPISKGMREVYGIAIVNGEEVRIFDRVKARNNVRALNHAFTLLTEDLTQ
jgi:hypothetical protein